MPMMNGSALSGSGTLIGTQTSGWLLDWHGPDAPPLVDVLLVLVLSPCATAGKLTPRLTMAADTQTIV